MTSRDLKQKECLEKWVANKCVGSIIACTGFGKTRIAINAIVKFLSKNSGKKVIVVVPTENLQMQWKCVCRCNYY